MRWRLKLRFTFICNNFNSIFLFHTNRICINFIKIILELPEYHISIIRLPFQFKISFLFSFSFSLSFESMSCPCNHFIQRLLIKISLSESFLNQIVIKILILINLCLRVFRGKPFKQPVSMGIRQMRVVFLVTHAIQTKLVLHRRQSH